VIVVLTGPGVGFPQGLASTVRVAALARGLHGQGGRVCLLCLGPSEFPSIAVLNTEPKGVVDGVEFEYTCGRTVRGRTFFAQQWLVLRGLLQGFRRVRQLHREERVEALLLCSDKWATIPLFWLAARSCGAAYLLELSEEPFYQAESSMAWRVLRFVHDLSFRLFDGTIVISRHLERYMQRRLGPATAVLRVPALVDAEQFGHGAVPSPVSGRYVAFCGTLNEPKDGVLTLIRAFAMIATDFPDVRLVLIGDAYRESTIPVVREYARERGVVDRVVFTGLVGHGDLAGYLDGAVALALARPRSLQARAGFPTKLAEYLSTGRPVVVTRVGEIDTYLEDAVNVYFTAPNDDAALAECLRHVLSEPAEAAAVGRRGREVALGCFDFRANGQKLREFIDEIRAKQAAPASPGH
jgi:glycosyltransferase involved in cell wall biosynthesis